jgi:hypothetical protein
MFGSKNVFLAIFPPTMAVIKWALYPTGGPHSHLASPPWQCFPVIFYFLIYQLV